MRAKLSRALAVSRALNAFFVFLALFLFYALFVGLVAVPLRLSRLFQKTNERSASFWEKPETETEHVDLSSPF